MNKRAHVVYHYIPLKDDELELNVGDEIEVFGLEEEGWWKGKLKGRTGVFPVNFVEFVEEDHASVTSGVQSIAPNIASQIIKHNIFGTKTSKSSLSSNSDNSINTILTSTNNNLMMNNTQDQENSGLSCTEDVSATSSERRPKPIRGAGYVDMFTGAAKPKPLPADPTGNIASERVSTIIANALQKQIPKKLPPPAPVLDNGNAVQAPALPPKPVSQFSPLSQHSRPLPPTQPTTRSPQQVLPQSNQIREQARVKYAYEPLNDDELAIEVGDIINVLDKKIEDAGWWKGELRGRIGVFPDNFVEPIEIAETPPTNSEWSAKASILSQPATPNPNPSIEGKIKSVFATTPKGFNKELENNLEKHNGPASFLSVKRNKLQQMSTESPNNDTNIINENGKRETEIASSKDASPTTKLNHITANRAKGPSRRPPSNFLVKRNQIDTIARESNGRDYSTLGPVHSSLSTASTNQTSNHDSLSSLPVDHLTAPATGSFPSKPTDGVQRTSNSISNQIKPSMSLDNVLNDQLANQTPKTSQRANQVAPQDKSKAAVTPPWMVELRKTHQEKKRETPITNNTSSQVEEVKLVKVAEPSLATSHVVAPTQEALPINQQVPSDVTNDIKELRSDIRQLREEFKCVSELKDAIEAIKIDLKACQNVTDIQSRYIRELVNNFADEREKITAMQKEIDRTLKLPTSSK